jgi:hypothetical protein
MGCLFEIMAALSNEFENKMKHGANEPSPVPHHKVLRYDSRRRRNSALPTNTQHDA